MAFPNLPGKQAADPLVTPAQHSEYRHAESETGRMRLPEAVVLCYSRGLMDYLTETHDGQHVGNYYGDLYSFADADYAVGVLGNFGIGAPTTAMLMDELVADGVETFLSIGFAGCLDDTIEMGDFIVCDKAIRDEGTSHHYAESEKFAHASESLTDETIGLLRERDERFHVGPSWTIDAMYRETKREVERYADEGVLTVEMEASAVFTVAAHRGVDAASMFVVSDYLGPADWEPKFHLTREDMHDLGDTAKAVLENGVA
ncbi:nucleoside phosphorylase [Haladaptatus sp. T7]|uniref:nucleoside phosphorylase n=1 Tax=Haladaptatus sp. T7 TaxID=2029368 RepID=UPI0021A25311|nr:nucleoside phosphorylase [Haladaptatus sp. T7]GKZ12225.1 phosphorylase [Haladaptatus sp. T7]